jgi:hypothetical protein
MDPSKFIYEEPEDRDFTLLPKGEYPWTILEINAMIQTQKGDAMLPVKFEFTGPHGEKAQVYENFVFTDAAAWKIKQFLKASYDQMEEGKAVDFTDSTFIRWMKARTGRANLGVEMVKGKSKNYERNKIESFITGKKTESSGAPPAASKADPAAVNDEEIPF